RRSRAAEHGAIAECNAGARYGKSDYRNHQNKPDELGLNRILFGVVVYIISVISLVVRMLRKYVVMPMLITLASLLRSTRIVRGRKRGRLIVIMRSAVLIGPIVGRRVLVVRVSLTARRGELCNRIAIARTEQIVARHRTSSDSNVSDMNQRIYVIRCRRPRVAREKSQLIRPNLDEHTTSLLLSIVE